MWFFQSETCGLLSQVSHLMTTPANTRTKLHHKPNAHLHSIRLYNSRNLMTLARGHNMPRLNILEQEESTSRRCRSLCRGGCHPWSSTRDRCAVAAAALTSSQRLLPCRVYSFLSRRTCSWFHGPWYQRRKLFTATATNVEILALHAAKRNSITNRRFTWVVHCLFGIWKMRSLWWCQKAEWMYR